MHPRVENRRDHDSRNCSARNISGREQDTATLVAFGNQFDVRQILVAKFDPQITIDQQPDHPTDKDRAGRCERQINADCKCERGDSTHLQHNRYYHAEQHKSPREFTAQNSFNDVRH